MKLTRIMVCGRTRQDNLKNVKTLNYWGANLQNVDLIKDMPNVEVLSLSVNRIDSLEAFSNCKRLRELYLRQNNIQHLDEIKYLEGLPLEVLWLTGNPCAENPDYRRFIISRLPNLKKLDNDERPKVSPGKFRPREGAFQNADWGEEISLSSARQQRQSFQAEAHSEDFKIENFRDSTRPGQKKPSDRGRRSDRPEQKKKDQPRVFTSRQAPSKGNHGGAITISIQDKS
eukprot:jgi/Bigna1/79406/fgenesh1_pg.62_\